MLWGNYKLFGHDTVVSVYINNINYFRPWYNGEKDEKVVFYFSGNVESDDGKNKDCIIVDDNYKNISMLKEFAGFIEVIKIDDKKKSPCMVNPIAVNYGKSDKYDSNNSVIYFRNSKKYIIINNNINIFM